MLWEALCVAFLSTKDIVQMEAALVHEEARVELFNMVRAGPAFDLPFQSMYQWLRKNNLVAKYCSFEAIDASEHEELHNHVESLSANRTLHKLKKYPRLCDKVSSLRICSTPPVFASEATPGQLLRKLQSFSVNAEQYREAWVLELLQANPALQTLNVEVDIHHPPAQGWFSEVAKLCAGLVGLTLWGLREGQDDNVLWQVAEHCPALRRLHLNYLTSRADAALPEAPMVAIAQQCKQLESIFGNATIVTPTTVSAICLHCRNLTSLRVGDVTLTSGDLLHLLPQHRKQPVTELACRWALQDESEVHACAVMLSGLQKLTMTVQAHCERAFAAAAKHLSGLHELGITILGASTPDTDAILFTVAEHCRLLRWLSLGTGETSGKAVAAIVERNRYLRSFLWWHGAQGNSSDAALCALGRCCPLIDCIECAGVTDASVQAIAEGCRHLESLIIGDSPVTEKSLESLSLHCSVLDASRDRSGPHCAGGFLP